MKLLRIKSETLRNITITPIIYWIGILLLVFSACSTQKNTFINRNYHSITTKYNGYFNARESYREGVRRLVNMHEDNYEEILSVFRYGTEQNARVVASNMDVAYQKASTAIRRHSMSIKGVEYNRWIDDSFFLIARSHFFKRDYNLAVLTFEYIIRQYDTSIKYRSKIWVAKSYIAAGEFNNAQQALDRVSKSDQEGLLGNDARLLFNKVYADFHLRQKNYGKAVTYLDNAINLTSGRRNKARLTFILAQAYQYDQNFAKAQQTYAQVLKMNPEFQMAFQARINMAMAFDTKTGDSAFILSELNGMLKNSRNREFKDQIYYALAQFSMRQQKEKEAIDYYQLSIDNYLDNDSQKGLSFLRLGEIYFKRQDYLKAARHYDSTMVYLSRGYPTIEQITATHKILQELASNMVTIQREDSLQRLASLSPMERNTILDGIITEIELKAQQERELEQERARMRQDMARRGTQPAAGEGDGGWYFYNPSAMSFGQNEFYARWGNRRLEDLWRISNKRVIAFGDIEGAPEEDMEGGLPGGRVTRASLMENLPMTPEKLKTSNSRVAKAYYNKGLIYKNNLEDYPNAIRSFEALINRFPNDENVLYGTYFLFSLLQQTGNQAKADVYRNLIISRFPDTDFAKILRDPNYAENIRAREQRSKILYERAFQAYSSGDYRLAIQLSDESYEMELSNELAGQFSFLKALAVGKTSSQNDFKKQLSYVTQHFKGTQVHEPAVNLLAYLGTGTDIINYPEETPASVAGQVVPPDGQSIFAYNPEAVHFYILVVNSRDIQIRQLRNQVNIFNRISYAELELNMSTLFFEEGKQLVTITNFPNAAEAQKYGKALMDSEQMKEFNADNYEAFSISVENYPLFYQERKLNEYLRFFAGAYR
jgi:tetratricopeptide (TPR) repeat protein